MTPYSGIRFGAISLPWRQVEVWGAAFVIYAQTGAFGPLEQKVVLAPAYAITLALMVNNSGQILLALRRSPLMTFLLILPFISIIWSESGSTSMRRAVSLTLSMGLAYVLATRFSPRQLLLLVGGVLGASLAGSLAVLIVAPATATMPDGTMRGLFGHKNLLGWYAAVALVLAAIMMMQAAIPRWSGLAIFAVGLPCLVLSGSMTAVVTVVVAAFLALFYTLLRRLNGPGRALLVLLTLQAFVLAYFVGSAIVASSLESLGKDASLTGRVPLWNFVDDAIRQRPLLGYGYEAFWSDGSAAGWQIRTLVAWDTPNAHQGYRDILLSFGLVGFVPFTIVIIRTLGRAAQHHRLAPDDSWLGLNVLLGMFLVMNTAESIFYNPHSYMFTLFITIVLMVAIRTPDFYCRPTDQRGDMANASLSLRPT